MKKPGLKARRQLARQELARQRLDLLLLPNMLFSVAKVAEVDLDTWVAIQAACLEPIAHRDRVQWELDAKRATALVHEVMDDFKGHTLAKVMVMVFRLMEMVTQQGIIEVSGDHPFVRAMEAMAAELADEKKHPGAWTPEIDQSAAKQARKVLARLQAKGHLLPPEEN